MCEYQDTLKGRLVQSVFHKAPYNFCFYAHPRCTTWILLSWILLSWIA